MFFQQYQYIFHGTSRNEHSMTISETDGTIFGTNVEGIEGLGTAIVNVPFNEAWNLPIIQQLLEKVKLTLKFQMRL